MVAQSASLSPHQSALLKAFGRATAEKIVVFRTGNPHMLGVAAIVDDRWARKPHTIVSSGEHPQEGSGFCPAGSKSRGCKHLAAAIFARKHHIDLRRPALIHDPLAEAFS
jgi:hypothetical protein